jgi:4,5-dihydroxyphthalate decarboxylase
VAKPAITVAMWNYDRVQAIVDGRVTVEGCEAKVLVLPPAECFRRAYVDREFEVSEIGLSPYLIAHSRGQSPYVALPIFLSRMFRHSAIYVRSDRGIGKPGDLAGKTVGVPEYQMTAALWVRGFLQDVYGVSPADMRWRQGGAEKFPLNLPPGFPLQPIGAEQNLSQMLAHGELDAIVSAAPPSCYRDGRSPVARLFEDYEPVEREYFRQTGIFPVMHALGVRQDIHARQPWLAENLMQAFGAAKTIAMRELDEVDALKITLPWVGSHYRSTRELMGEDYWSYGIEQNRRTLEAMTRYSYEQGLAVRKLAVEELFARA